MSLLIADCISHVLEFCPLAELTSVVLVNKTWHAGLTSSVWLTQCKTHLGKEMTNVKLQSKCVKLYRKLFGDDHPVIENLLLSRDDKEPGAHKVSNVKKVDYHKSLKGYVIGKLRRREGDELKKLIRLPLQLVFGEGDGRKIDRKVAFERKWKKVNEFLKDELKKKHISYSISEMFMKRVKRDLNLVFKKDQKASFELGRRISQEIASGQYLQRFGVMKFYELFLQYLDSSLVLSDQVQLVREKVELSFTEIEISSFETFKVLLDFAAKYCPKQEKFIRNHIEKDTTKDSSLKSFLFEKPQRLIGHYLLEKRGMRLFAQISDGFEYLLEECKFVIPNFLVDCLIFKSEKLANGRGLAMVDAYSKCHNIPYLNVDFMVQLIAQFGKVVPKKEILKNIEALLPKINDDPNLPLIFRITACNFDGYVGSDDLLALMSLLCKFSKVVFKEDVKAPYRDPLIFIACQMTSAFGTYSNEKEWVDLLLEFLNKGSRKKFMDYKTLKSFAQIVDSKPFPRSVRYILVDYLGDYE